MFELIFCSIFTILPDFLYRRFAQGKRIGQEINLFSVWYELRWGLTACFILTVLLITTIFYYHPSTTVVSSFFRTVTILPETNGRVEEVYVATGQEIEAGAPIFRLDSTSQQAAVDAARKHVDELDAEQAVAASDLAAAQGNVDQARSALEQAQNELARNLELQERNPNVVPGQTIDRLTNVADARQGALDSAIANQQAVEARITTLLPAQKASAEAALNQAQVELDKTLVEASIAGRIEQFQLQPGDIVNPLLRPAGILVPHDHQEGHFIAGFDQLAAQVVKPGMIAEVACSSYPFRIVPMVVDSVQDVIATGQFRPSDQLLDTRDRMGAGTVTVRLNEIYPGQADAIPPGSTCVANAYTDNHAALEDPSLSTFKKLRLHVIDTVGIVHAILLRLQVVFLPVQQLVFAGGH